MPDIDIKRLRSRPSRARESEAARPAEHFNEGPSQAEVFRDLTRYLAIFLAIALALSLLGKLLTGG
jgi:hypothetical protein